MIPRTLIPEKKKKKKKNHRLETKPVESSPSISDS